MNWNKQSKQGMILLEAVIIVGILCVLLALMMPSYAQSIEKTKQSICEKNCKDLETLYELDLLIRSSQASEEAFDTFLTDQAKTCCPDEGTILYIEGTVTCTKHKKAIKDAKK